MPTWPPSTSHPERSGLPPGVYERLARVAPVPEVRLDVAAFVGLTERGPVAEATGVDSMSAFAERFGRRGGGRLLPEAVHLFFANGGRQAVVVRAAPDTAVVTRGHLPQVVVAGTSTEVQLEARDPGLWGDDLDVQWRWERHPLPVAPGPDLLVDPALAPAVGALLRVTVTGVAPASTTEELRFVDDHEPQPDGRVRLVLDGPVPVAPAGGVLGLWQELRGRLFVRWADRTEIHEGVAVDPAHPDGLVARLEDSRLLRLVDPTARWLPAEPLLGADAFQQGQRWAIDVHGSDRPEDTVRTLFVDVLDALDAWDDGAPTEPVSLVSLPDLGHRTVPLDAVETGDDPAWGTRFGSCVRPDPETTPPADLEWPALSLDHDRSGFDQAQVDLMAHCDPRRRVALLDLPPGLSAGDVVAWRSAHAGDRSAAYAPWLRLDRDGGLVEVPPCGAVAGVIARVEAGRGVHAAPANEDVRGVLGPVDDPLLPDAGFLHQERIDALRDTERGVRILGSRTTSFDPDWTHLGVRRLVDWLSRQLALDAQWAVFEPNGRRLWRRLTRMVERRLTRLGAAGAWAGDTAATSWFVRCDETTTTQADRDAGRVVVQVGVAPSVPVEFLVFELALVVEAGGG